MSIFVRYLAFGAMGLAMLITGTASAATTMSLELANDLFAAGNAFYRTQKYEEARQAYRELIQAGYDTAPVLYNMGTVDARLGSSTEAMAYLMRARNLRPRDADIRANLEYISPETKGVEADAPTAESLWSRVSGYLTAEEWLAILWVALTLTCCAASMYWLAKNARAHIAARVMLWIGVVILILVAAPTATQFYRSRYINKAIVLKGAEMLSGPARRFTRVADLSEGQIVRQLGDDPSGYKHVRLDSGLQGYVNSDALMEL